MESFKQFLDSASINGLNHIASTRKWTRFFWISLVTLGFLVSTYLIWESFQTWMENPVRTTTKTVPMTEIKFPKLTVCPPKNTFTDFNYDLVLTENVTITKEKRNELYEYAVELIDEYVYMDLWDKMHEENRFLNWYTGLTSMHEQPFYQEGYYNYKITTSATSGAITSQYFGEIYNPSLVENNQNYKINVWPARNIRYNENVTLHFKIEKLHLPVRGGIDDFISQDQNSDGLRYLDKNTIQQISFSPPAIIDGSGTTSSLRFINNRREASNLEISETTLKLMPGFRLSWYYTGLDFKSDPLLEFPIWKNNHKFSKFNKDFIREANKKSSQICFVSSF